MKVAFARGGLWFFTSILLFLLFTNSEMKTFVRGDELLSMLVVGIIGGGTGFFLVWYNDERDKSLGE